MEVQKKGLMGGGFFSPEGSNGLVETELFKDILRQSDNPLGILLESQVAGDVTVEATPLDSVGGP